MELLIDKGVFHFKREYILAGIDVYVIPVISIATYSSSFNSSHDEKILAYT